LRYLASQLAASQQENYNPVCTHFSEEEMAMSSTTQLATAVALDYDNLYDDQEDELAEKLYELVDGKKEAKIMGSSRHGGVGTRLIIELGAHVKLNRLGAVYGPDTTYQISHNERMPDVSFLAAERIPSEGETEKKWPLAPDLAAEVISPSETWLQVQRKLRDYFAAGVQQVWLLSPELGEAHVYDSPKGSIVLTEDDDLVNETLLPGFRCRISELFQQPAHS
jgi:Uma2 family endonuclease